MEGNNIYIKNMVCKRCILTVSNIFQENGITPASVELGTVVLSEPIPKEKQESIRRRLEEYGFEVIDDKRMRIIEQIRIGVIEFVRHPELFAGQMPQGIQCAQQAVHRNERHQHRAVLSCAEDRVGERTVCL